MKKVLIAVAVLGVVLISLGWGYKTLSRHIYDSRSCAIYVIDNLELHARMDVPALINHKSGASCAFDAAKNTKKAFYAVDLQKLDLKKYMGYMRLHRLTSGDSVQPALFLNAPSVDPAPGLFYRKETRHGETWHILFNTRTGGLWVSGNYAD